ncbi:unnamed protein product [Enterobius vermicularis]|uniref:Phorbol-ester/DAG-type domain-containing protein n=1 Tax=Enterobius vermicularis TaxID=51028 RepID=A0A0N4VAW0_ENTVE|nr:unnamed protein product [Enterobius vermicularis]
MSDYAVCYTNHRKYSRPSSTVVRFFTNIPLKSFSLRSDSNYRYCDMCERYVAISNKHCGLCGVCPSKVGVYS